MGDTVKTDDWITETVGTHKADDIDVGTIVVTIGKRISFNKWSLQIEVDLTLAWILFGECARNISIFRVQIWTSQ